MADRISADGKIRSGRPGRGHDRSGRGPARPHAGDHSQCAGPAGSRDHSWRPPARAPGFRHRDQKPARRRDRLGGVRRGPRVAGGSDQAGIGDACGRRSARPGTKSGHQHIPGRCHLVGVGRTVGRHRRRPAFATDHPRQRNVHGAHRGCPQRGIVRPLPWSHHDRSSRVGTGRRLVAHHRLCPGRKHGDRRAGPVAPLLLVDHPPTGRSLTALGAPGRRAGPSDPPPLTGPNGRCPVRSRSGGLGRPGTA